jgi:hypothetical protein
MVIELSWTIVDADICETRCCVCRHKFARQVIETKLVSDSDRLDLGEVCPTCIERGADYIEERMRENLAFSSMLAEAQAYMEKRALAEDLESCPTFEEYELLKAGVGGPRYASAEEAGAAWERGEW